MSYSRSIDASGFGAVVAVINGVWNLKYGDESGKMITERQWADAHLFVTAPDMLAALENIRDTVESCYVAGGWVPLDAEEMQAIGEDANAAIAKAKGES